MSQSFGQKWPERDMLCGRLTSVSPPHQQQSASFCGTCDQLLVGTRLRTKTDFCCPSTRQFLSAYRPDDSLSLSPYMQQPFSLSSYASSPFNQCKDMFFLPNVQNAQSYVSYVSYVMTAMTAGPVHQSQSGQHLPLRWLRRKGKVLTPGPISICIK